MGYNNRKPQHYHGGIQDKRRASELNQIIDALLSQISGSGGAEIRKYGDRLVIGSAHPDDTTGKLAMPSMYCTVINEDYDYLIVQPYHFGSGGPVPNQVYDVTLPTTGPNNTNDTIMYIAKPLWLQRTFWSGQTVNIDGLAITYQDAGLGIRTARSGAIVETQKITPAYFTGEILLLSEAPTQLIDPNGNPIVWVDMNQTARVWAVECP